MGIGIENQKDKVVISIPLHHDISSLIIHFRELADKLEQIHYQDFPDNKCMKMTESDKVEEIAVKHLAHPYCFLELGISKNYDFEIIQFENQINGH